jgi:hypothetical protein
MSHTALAQTGSGRIAGSVKDATGAVISGSSVTLTNTATNVAQTTTSNEEGIFNFPVVSIGQYRHVLHAADPRIGQIAAKFRF